MQDGNTDPNTPSTNSAEETAGTFFPIHLAALVDGSVPKFSLYIQSDPNKPPALYSRNYGKRGHWRTQQELDISKEAV